MKEKSIRLRLHPRARVGGAEEVKRLKQERKKEGRVESGVPVLISLLGSRRLAQLGSLAVAEVSWSGNCVALWH